MNKFIIKFASAADLNRAYGAWKMLGTKLMVDPAALMLLIEVVWNQDDVTKLTQSMVPGKINVRGHKDNIEGIKPI